MWNRVAVLLRARLWAQKEGSALPLASWLLTFACAALLCAVVRDALGSHAYAIFALSVTGVLVAVPLVGEFGSLLVFDEASDWVRALPLRPIELRIARALHLLVATWTLALAPLAAATLTAPSSLGLAERALLFACGIGLALCVAAAILWLQALLSRVEPLLVAVQTMIVAGAIVAAVLGLRWVGELRAIDEPMPGALAAYAPAWFALPFAPGASAGQRLLPLLVSLASGALLVVAPSVSARGPRSTRSALGALLAPLRSVAIRAWVRRDERATFELVFDALPREREFVLRTYPLLGVPLAFLALGLRGESAGSRQGLLALLCFTTATYLPILIAHVPVSRSANARWMLDTAPVDPRALSNGALKAIAVRFLVPLYTGLAVLAFAQGELALALRLVPVAALVALAIVRATWPFCVAGPPLSTAPEDLRVPLQWGNVLLTLGILTTLLAVAAQRWVAGPTAAAVAVLALVALEVASDRAWRRSA